MSECLQFWIPAQKGISPHYPFVSQSSTDDIQTDIAGQGACKFASVKIPAQSSMSSPHTLEDHSNVDDTQNDSAHQGTYKLVRAKLPAQSSISGLSSSKPNTDTPCQGVFGVGSCFYLPRISEGLSGA